jgi:uncharacterized membrane protein
MAAAVLHRVLAIFVGLGDLLAAHPILGTIYLVLFTALGRLAMWFVWRGESRRAFWCAVATILVDFLFSWGDDTFSHIYRIRALAEQVSHGAFNQFLVNPITGETLPVFVYYNVLPYVIPTVLNLVGAVVRLAAGSVRPVATGDSVRARPAVPRQNN